MQAPPEKGVTITVEGDAVKCNPERLGQKRKGAIRFTFAGGGAKWVAILPMAGPFSDHLLGNLITPPKLTTRVDSGAEVGSGWKYSVLVQLEQKVLAVDPQIIIDPDEG